MAYIADWGNGIPQGGTNPPPPGGTIPDFSSYPPISPNPFGGTPPTNKTYPQGGYDYPGITQPPTPPTPTTTPVGNQELAAYINYLKSLGLDTAQINSIISDPNKTINYNGTKYTAAKFWDMWAKGTYGDTPPASPYTPQVSLGDDKLIPEGYSYHPAGFLIGPDGEYYDYGAWIDTGYQSFVPVSKDTAETVINAWAKNQGGDSTTFLGGVPERETDSSGQEWWVYKDPDGNILRVERVDDSSTNMTAYEKAQFDLARDQFEWNKEQSRLEQQRADEQRFTSPREWIQRWGMYNPDTLPQTPAWLTEHTGLAQGAPIGNVAGAKELASGGRYAGLADATGRQLNPLGIGSPILASGQSLRKLTPTELEGTLGYMDWAAGRGSPYASGEDWQYRSAQLLPTNQPRRTVAWNPNQRA